MIFNIDLLTSAIKPHISPAFKNAEKEIIRAINKAQQKHFPDNEAEIAFCLANRNNEIIIVPVVISDDGENQSIEIANEAIQADLIKPQGLVKFILKKSSTVLKQKK